ncbi:MAG: beta-galactosidase domain 4-containing protein, partial [Verrucomicrobiota bacterium]
AASQGCQLSVEKIAKIMEDLSQTGDELFIQFNFSLKKSNLWAPKGFVIAWEQFPWPSIQTTKTHEEEFSSISLEKRADYISLVSGSNIYRISTASGLIEQINLSGRNILASPMRWNFWRALTDNDRGWGGEDKMASWKEAEQEIEVESILIETEPLKNQTLRINAKIPSKLNTSVTYYGLRGGRLGIDIHYEFPRRNNQFLQEIPRLGIQFTLPENYHQLSWYGRGPHENYSDRKQSAAIGLYHSTVEDWVTPYVRPQENANRTDLRWLTISEQGPNGLSISAQAGTTFSASTWPYSINDLIHNTHDFQIPQRNFITMNLDSIQRGVGGDNSWGLPVHEAYKISTEQSHRLHLAIGPYRESL